MAVYIIDLFGDRTEELCWFKEAVGRIVSIIVGNILL